MIVQTKIIPAKKGFFVHDFSNNGLDTNTFVIVYKKRNILGKLLLPTSKLKVTLPKGSKMESVLSNKPKVGQVQVKYFLPKKAQ